MSPLFSGNIGTQGYPPMKLNTMPEGLGIYSERQAAGFERNGGIVFRRSKTTFSYLASVSLLPIFFWFCSVMTLLLRMPYCAALPPKSTPIFHFLPSRYWYQLNNPSVPPFPAACYILINIFSGLMSYSKIMARIKGLGRYRCLLGRDTLFLC
jgi:hypothetical protein